MSTIDAQVRIPIAIPTATPTNDGLLSASDKKVLDTLAVGTGGELSAEQITETESRVFVSPSERSKLSGIESGAKAAGVAGDAHAAATGNPHGATAADIGADPAGTAATLVDAITPGSIGAARKVHVHAITDVEGLGTALTGKAPSSHAHVINDMTGLQAALDGKAALAHSHTPASIGAAAAVHTHAIADTTGLQAALDALQASISAISATPVTYAEMINSGTAPDADFIFCKNTVPITCNLTPNPARKSQIFVLRGGTASTVQFFGGPGQAINGGNFIAAGGTNTAPTKYTFVRDTTTQTTWNRA